LFRGLALCAGLAVLVGWSLACATGRQPPPPPSTEALLDQPPTPSSPEEEAALRERARGMVDRMRVRRADYVLGPEDRLRITVWSRPDLSKEGRIRPDGMLFISLVGNVQASGLTVGQLQDVVRQKLARVLRDPQVDIEITEYGSKVYYVFGMAARPGIYPVRATTTLLEGVANAGGPTERANIGSAYLIRAGTVVPIDFYGLFQRGDVSQNLLLADGDVIYIPSLDDAKVYVLGEVMRAAAVPLRGRGMRLSEAIAMAGGFNEYTAYKREIKIVRGSLGNPKVYTIDYTEILRGERPDAPFLQNGDIVYVPATGLTKWDRVLSQMLPTLSSIVVDAAAIDSLSRR
jgi:polysaccharide export outer membrane protein